MVKTETALMKNSYPEEISDYSYVTSFRECSSYKNSLRWKKYWNQGN
jgi:hypothetical protein